MTRRQKLPAIKNTSRRNRALKECCTNLATTTDTLSNVILRLRLISRARLRRCLRSKSRIPPGPESLFSKFKDRSTIFRDDFPPRGAAQHGEINSAEA